MKKSLLVVIVVLSLTCSGCVPLIAGGLIGAVVVKSTNGQRRPKLTELQRRSLECKEIEGRREDVLRATVTVFQDRGYSVKTSDYQGGIIAAQSEKPFFDITTTIEEFTPDRIKMRVTIKDKDGVVEDGKVFVKLFEEIQAEVFRRTNLSK